MRVPELFQRAFGIRWEDEAPAEPQWSGEFKVASSELGRHAVFQNALTVVVVVLCAVVTCAAGPPAPNPQEPVDYVAWLNRGFMKRMRDNAAEKYQAAVEAFKEDNELVQLVLTDPRRWTDAQRTALREWVKSNDAALQGFAQAAAKPQCYFEVKSADGSLASALMPSYKGMRRLCQVTAARGDLRLLDGDADAAASDAITILAAARHMEAQPVLIASLVGFSMRAYGYELLRRIPELAGQNVDCGQLAARVQKADPEPRTLKRQFYAEKLMAWDTCQRFARDRDGDGRYEELRLPLLEQQPEATVLPEPRTFDQNIELINEWYAEWEEVFKLEYAAAKPQIEKIDRQLEARRGTVLAMVAVDLSRALLIHTRMSATRRGTHLLLRLHAHRAQHGQWPQDLKTVVPADMPTLATDPFSGKPFVYRLKDGEPTLYSIGDNGKDDGGQVFRKGGIPCWGETGDYVFWPPPSPPGS